MLAASVRFERTSVGLEGPTPCPTARLNLDQSLGIEPSSDFVGNEVSHHVTLRVWLERKGSNLWSPSYQLGALPLSYSPANWSECGESNTVKRAPKARGQPMTHARISGRRGRNRTCCGLVPGQDVCQ
jgi:hypothetical protein